LAIIFFIFFPAIFLFIFSGSSQKPDRAAFIFTDHSAAGSEDEANKYKDALATFFWVGEPADENNGFIDNYGSIWDENWQESYGGFDDPDWRCGYKPCGFEPKENPFYFALPYDDLDDYGKQKESAKEIPWYSLPEEGQSILKNTWIELLYDNKKAYAQWEDVGPFETDDFGYVFGDKRAYLNKTGVGAGLDISPATRDYLGMPGNDIVKWRFIPQSEVPDGPWKEIITASKTNRIYQIPGE
jgi:hypothetical protein